MHRSFANFGKIFFQAALVGLLFKKRSSKKEARIIKYQDKSKAYGFSSRSKYLCGKCYLGYVEIPPGQAKVKTFAASYKCNIKFTTVVM